MGSCYNHAQRTDIEEVGEIEAQRLDYFQLLNKIEQLSYFHQPQFIQYHVICSYFFHCKTLNINYLKNNLKIVCTKFGTLN